MHNSEESSSSLVLQPITGLDHPNYAFGKYISLLYELTRLLSMDLSNTNTLSECRHMLVFFDVNCNISTETVGVNISVYDPFPLCNMFGFTMF
jgi:hypothetical protein